MKTSETISKLSAALIDFHAAVPKVTKEAKNPFYGNKYASLSNILEVVSKPLNEAGLAIIQLPAGVNQLETILIHESGEYISEIYEMKPSKQDPQGLGSAITYQRRYALGAILSLNIDEDDDGNKASEPEKKAIKSKEKLKMDDDRFAKMIDYCRNCTPLEAGNAIGKARLSFIFDNEQEKIIKEWEDNL